MRHKVKKVKLGTDKDHTISIMRTLAMQVIIHEKIQTTGKKAKAVQPFVERLITLAKRKTDKKSAIREIEKLLQHESSSKKIFEVLLDRYKDKTSGFTSLIKIGNRKGDNASIVQLELIQ